jgi:phosphatidylglycerophosphatase A
MTAETTNHDPQPRPAPGVVLRDPVHVLAFGFGTGLAPRAPGTFGTLVGVPIAFALALIAPWAHAVAVISIGAVGVWICGASAARLAIHDYPGIVFDEIAGFVVAMALNPFSWAGVAAVFVLFRAFDIAKPWPIGWLDKHITGGLGIMVDDVGAGIVAGIVWLVISQWIP